MNQESLEFSVTVSGTYWNKKPQFSIWLDDHVIIQTEISSESPQTHKFTHTIDDGEHVLRINLENKTSSDTVMVDGAVSKDMLLNIVDITVDDIALDQLLWSESTFLLDKPQEYQGKQILQLDNCVNLGWNGSYTLKFSSPFYIWLLEKL
jgi:hypothetical protein